MKLQFKSILSSFLLLCAHLSNAQYNFPTTLGPYSQNFDGMGTNTAGISFSNGTTASLPGIITGYAYGTTFASLVNAKPNDGTNSVTAAYNFGALGATDRALGGIAGGSGSSAGVGYICIRLRNTSGVTIQNLDVRYGIEQWYNTSNDLQAGFEVAYRKYANTTLFNNNDIVASTNWTDVPDLNLMAPATGGVLGKVDGNSTTYRRTAQQRLMGVNMANNSEIVIRLKYIFNSTTNGNGISVDDILIYPETNVLYSNTTGSLSQAASWFQNAAATTPATNVNFTTPNTTYYVQGSNSASRLGAGWQVTGANSRVVVGSADTPATLTLAAGDNMTATVDVNEGSTLAFADRLVTGTNVNVTLGALSTGSTVQYVATTGTQNVLSGNYANLTLGGNGSKSPRGSLTVASSLNLSQALSLGGYDVALLRGATIIRSTGGQVVTIGTGVFRQTVPGGAAAPVLFPLALSSAAADYLPVTITSGATDKDETYRAQLIPNVYSLYTRLTVGNLLNVAAGVTMPPAGFVNSTWYLGHETATDVAATLKFGWVGGSSREGSTLATSRASAYVNHFSNTTDLLGSWDSSPANVGATNAEGLWFVQRTDVSSFSPFTVMANPAPLPVVLTSFTAKRSGAGVVCKWETASEQHNDYFVVERSANSQDFVALSNVAGHGSTSAAHTYSFTDTRPAASLAYYRLRQVDVDGKTTYSAPVAVAGDATVAPTLVARPNPSTGRFTLVSSFPTPTQVQATVVNLLGQQVATLNEQVGGDSAALSLDLSQQPAGVYLVRLVGPTGPTTVRLVKN
jgi:hypothetical protein